MGRKKRVDMRDNFTDNSCENHFSSCTIPLFGLYGGHGPWPASLHEDCSRVREILRCWLLMEMQICMLGMHLPTKAQVQGHIGHIPVRFNPKEPTRLVKSITLILSSRLNASTILARLAGGTEPSNRR